MQGIIYASKCIQNSQLITKQKYFLYTLIYILFYACVCVCVCV